MTPKNGGRPLPWHDTPTCADEKCKGPMLPVAEMANGYGGPRNSRIACAACGEGWPGTPEEVAKATRANSAWLAHERGEIHDDRGCARCNGPLPLDRTRLCAPCVASDNAERQASLF